MEISRGRTLSSRIEVPPDERSALATLMGYPDERRKAILHAIQGAEPKLLRQDFASQIAGKAQISEDEAQDAIRTLASLYVSMDVAGEPVDSFVEDICDAAKNAELKPNNDDWQSLKKWLRELLSQDKTLGVTAKAHEIMLAYDHVFCEARVVTDLRPVFGRDVKKGPEASVIVHQLKLTFHENGGGETRDFYVALDSIDVERLRRLLERAGRKEESLRAAAKRGDIHVLEV